MESGRDRRSSSRLSTEHGKEAVKPGSPQREFGAVRHRCKAAHDASPAETAMRMMRGRAAIFTNMGVT
jgi:hypothetical protein